jgi:hypothetical protein
MVLADKINQMVKEYNNIAGKPPKAMRMDSNTYKILADNIDRPLELFNTVQIIIDNKCPPNSIYCLDDIKRGLI